MKMKWVSLSWANVKWISLLLPLVAAGGCFATIEPGHRGLLFDSHHGGLQHDILNEGRHYVGAWGRLIDFDVTYSERTEDIHTISAEGLAMDLKLSISFRPVIADLYYLDVEVGENYYDEVLGPEFKTAARGVFSRHPYQEVQRQNEKVEDEVEAELRRRLAGKHIEISSVRLLEVNYAPEIVNADRAKLVGERDALRRKAADEAEAVRKKATLEADALRQKLELEQQAEREKLQTEAEIRQKEKERRLVEEQAAIDKVQAETEAVTKVTRAKAEAEAAKLMARARAEEKKAEATTLTPLMVQMHAYDALAKLGGGGTTIMLGDWSKVPNFLFPQFPFMHGGGKRVAAAPAASTSEDAAE
ncbi:MAG TPA: SPFH domain-containing protein [Polyangia bacterium]|nr:SPFH domain-containing protein [Polyangia bacterium]